MNKSKPRLSSLIVTTLIVAVGINLAWAGLLIILESIATANLSNSVSSYEYLSVDHQGKPFIAWTVRGGNQYEYRWLDGKLIDQAPRPTLSSAYLAAPDPTRAKFSAPRAWSERITWFTDGLKYPGSTTWFAIQDDTYRVYFAGYDDAVKQLVGYIGRDGFSRTQPSERKWFQLPGGMDWRIHSPGHQQEPGWMSHQINLSADILPWGIYFNDGAKLVEVDLRSRTVRNVLKDCPAVSISSVQDYLPHSAGAAQTPDTTPSTPDERQRLAVRTTDKILFVEALTGRSKEFSIPAEFRTRNVLTAWALPAQELLIADDSAYSSNARRLDLRRIDSSGQQLERLTVDLNGYIFPSERTVAWKAAPVGPAPLLWSLALAAGAVSKVQDRHESTFSIAFQTLLRSIWPPMLAVFLISLLAAAWVYRSERQHYGAHPLAWSITTFLLGPAMLVAYLIERGRPVTTTCGVCHAQVPAKRDACAKCGAEFPAPERTGCEIFA